MEREESNPPRLLRGADFMFDVNQTFVVILTFLHINLLTEGVREREKERIVIVLSFKSYSFQGFQNRRY